MTLDTHIEEVQVRFILVVTDVVPNYLVTVPLYRGISHKFGEALVNYVFCKHNPQAI